MELADANPGVWTVAGTEMFGLNNYSDGLEEYVRLVAIAADGTLRTGASWGEFPTAEETVVLGPDGTGYLLSYGHDAHRDTEITAFDLEGLRGGWPVRVKGRPIGLGFGPDGRIYVSENDGDTRRTRIQVFGPDGGSSSIGSDALPVAATSARSGAGPVMGAPPPIVAEDGTTFLVTEDRGTTVYALDPGGQVMRGWPFRDTLGLEWSFDDPDTGGTDWRLEPAIGPGNILYLLRPPRSANAGGSIVAIEPNGQVGQGWPVELTRPGAHFRMVDVGADGTVYALAVEPEGSARSSATMLAIAPDSTVLWTTTIVAP